MVPKSSAVQTVTARHRLSEDLIDGGSQPKGVGGWSLIRVGMVT